MGAGACLVMVIAACRGPGAGTTTTGEASPSTAAVTTVATETTSGAEPVEIRWFVGLGAGGCPEQKDAQNAAVEHFNDTHDDIELVIEIVQDDVACDTLATQIFVRERPRHRGPCGDSWRQRLQWAVARSPATSGCDGLRPQPVGSSRHTT